MIQSLIKEAKSYLGVKQGDSRHKDLVRKYNAVKPLPVGYRLKESDDWCAAFITVIGDSTNTSKYIGRECGVHRFVQLFKKNKIWRGLDKPKAGDLVVFDWRKDAWMDHIGLVEKLEGNQVTVIEGNSSRSVARRTYNWNDWRIAGYARPNYPKKTKQENNSLQDLISEVIAGKWGNGKERKQALKKAGYDPEEIQEKVNKQLTRKKPALKSNPTIAKEVISGKWGNGQERKKALEKAGYNYQLIRKLVNQSL